MALGTKKIRNIHLHSYERETAFMRQKNTCRLIIIIMMMTRVCAYFCFNSITHNYYYYHCIISHNYISFAGIFFYYHFLFVLKFESQGLRSHIITAFRFVHKMNKIRVRAHRIYIYN